MKIVISSARNLLGLSIIGLESDHPMLHTGVCNSYSLLAVLDRDLSSSVSSSYLTHLSQPETSQPDFRSPQIVEVKSRVMLRYSDHDFLMHILEAGCTFSSRVLVVY